MKREQKKLSGAASFLDSPRPGTAVFGESLSISGWLHAPNRELSHCRIAAWIDDVLVGETAFLFVRPDVCAALRLADSVGTGFRILGEVPSRGEAAQSAEVVVTAAWPEEAVEYEIGRCAVRLLPALLSQRPYGDVVHSAQTRLLHRENIYGSGPPIEEPGAETLQLIEQYLAADSTVLDVGCGAGAYGPALIARGHGWLGLEVNPAYCELLARRNLPHRKVNAIHGSVFPCADAEFENAICIEVLEHIEDVENFLREMSRSIRRRALFSVPNIEVLPYFSAWQVVPWHLLEADHKNFFTRASLRALLEKYFRRVEVFSYAEHPLRTPEGIPLHVHLFAVAEN